MIFFLNVHLKSCVFCTISAQPPPTWKMHNLCIWCVFNDFVVWLYVIIHVYICHHFICLYMFHYLCRAIAHALMFYCYNFLLDPKCYVMLCPCMTCLRAAGSRNKIYFSVTNNHISNSSNHCSQFLFTQNLFEPVFLWSWHLFIMEIVPLGT
jgi:hypothetical protein